MKSLCEWLDSKVSDDTIQNKYSKTSYNLPPHLNRNESIEYFYRYYTKNDEDIDTADTFYPNFIDHMRNLNPEDLRNDEELKFLDSITERYGKEHKFLIPPNTNRYHTNFLFKHLIDVSDNSGYNYETVDLNDKVVRLPFIDKELKQSFYKFCKDNTYT